MAQGVAGTITEVPLSNVNCMRWQLGRLPESLARHHSSGKVLIITACWRWHLLGFLIRKLGQRGLTLLLKLHNQRMLHCQAGSHAPLDNPTPINDAMCDGSSPPSRSDGLRKTGGTGITTPLGWHS